ncbi:N-acetylglucosamine-specific PTS transporter subunit IIBC [Schaalia hyovaginalis]|uniref:N-acetylglucosamine-specific PTS transporter subunit IIBC n=1 Tax=Schaalia hyovaginalis TaxID=29316 RepID=UPI002A753076|nr:N-acetylglucosamine-specific PTS transporter subunit IIBC [Schaalia hyovaginalis]MDY2669624.1 N-acetylglucosamine-specific PTS transporter subunit IIBC [Schaalia hyovaginalis]
MDAIMTSLQKLGKALMGAVAVMPVAALLMGIGYWIDPEGWGANSILAAVLIKAGAAILDYLGWIFAVAIAFGLAKDSNGASALGGFIGYGTVTALLSEKAVAGYRGVDLEALEGAEKLAWIADGWGKINNGNVLIGILVGVLAAWTYNHFHNTKLPDALAFFSGRRLVPIMMSFFSMILSGILYLVWPFLYSILFHFGQWIVGHGALGAGLYGFFNRLLIPTGLHHALNQIFWFDVAGINDIGDFLGGGKTIEAAAAATDAASCPGVWDAAAGSCEVIGYVGMYQAGFFPVMMFGLPAAALAMYLRADSKRKKTVASLMMAGALASFFTGVTEPLEFSFMFAAPILYILHALLTGIAVTVAAAMHWTAGFGFSAGFVDMFLSTQNPIAHKWYMLLLQGVVWAVIYFIVFYFLIPILKLKTPGRDDEDDTDVDTARVLAPSRAAQQILEGLGGAANIVSIDYCATRLRVAVADHLAVKESQIKKAGVPGVIRPSQKSVQVIIGPQVQFVYDEVAALLASSGAELKGEQSI